MDSPLLRTGDRANVRFKFMYNPEYISVGSTLLFREGRTKGMGKITKLFYPEDKVASSKKATKARARVGEKQRGGEARGNAPTPSKVKGGESKMREAPLGTKSPKKASSPKSGRLRTGRQQPSR